MRLLLPAVLLLASCSTPPDTDLVRTASTPSLPAPKPRAYPVGSGSPARLAALAQQHNPRLVALRRRAERLQALVPQAAALPDPQAKVSAGNLAETAAGKVRSTVSLSQKIPFPGKRKAASRAAAHQAAAARAEAEAQALRVAEQTQHAWWDRYLAEKTIDLTLENRKLLLTAQEVVAARVAAADASQSDLLRIDTEISKLDRDLATLRQLSGAARARLNALLNRPAGASLPRPLAATLPAPASLDPLLRRAARLHPGVAAAEQRALAANQKLRRARLEKFPDLTAAIQHGEVSTTGLSPLANGKDQTMLTLGFNLPLWQEPRRAMIREATAGIEESRALIDATRAELRQQIEDAYLRARTAREISALYRQRLIPSSRQAFDLSLASYASSAAPFISVIDTQRQLLAHQLQLVQSRAQLGKAIASLQAAAALPTN